MRYQIFEDDRLLTLNEFDRLCCEASGVKENPDKYSDLYQLIIGCLGGLAYTLKVQGKETVEEEISMYNERKQNIVRNILYKYRFEFF